jgi:hypothetical protein
VLRHEHFEEICAAASIGQATAEELVQLEEHASECDGCRQAYSDYLNVAAQQFAAAEQDRTLSPQEAQEFLNSKLFTRRFFNRAEREGIVFSHDVDQEIKLPSSNPFAESRRPFWQTYARPIAAVILIAVMLSTAYSYRRGLFNRSRAPLWSQSSTAPRPETPVVPLDQRIGELTTEKLKLQVQIDRLSGEMRSANDQLIASRTDLKSASLDRQKLSYDRDALEAQLQQVQRELAKSEAVVARAQQEAATQRDHASDVEATLIADQVKIHGLTDELKEKSGALDQERQLLALGHDVTDLMGARNLHIVDVADTDSRGKTRPAFGRIFFTEGKSLIFYAYDLNETKMQKANHQYQVWARKEGQNQQVQRLGMFYSDDTAQRRWVFKCEDPKILREIDSVFVTLGPANSDPSHPDGPSLMYAYLRGQPNHP